MKINCIMCEDLVYYYKGYRDDLFVIREAVKFYFVLPAFKEDVSYPIVNICDDCLYSDFAKFGIYFEGDENSCKEFNIPIRYLPITKEEAIKIALLS